MTESPEWAGDYEIISEVISNLEPNDWAQIADYCTRNAGTPIARVLAAVWIEVSPEVADDDDLARSWHRAVQRS